MRKNTVTRSHTILSFLPKWAFVCIITAVLTAIVLFNLNTILTRIGKFLIVDDASPQADIAVVIAGDLALRAMEAADLYKEGRVREILLTRGPVVDGAEYLKEMNIHVPEDHEISRQVLIASGVPEDKIHTDRKRAYSTFSEALNVFSFLKENGYSNAIIVTSRIHTRRVRLTYRRMLKPDNNLSITIRPSRHDPFPVNDWWRRRRDLRDVLLEYQKLFYYKLRYAFR